jgi:large subunit ribosomal protein L24
MKTKFSTSWIASVQPRKQRKYRYNAPLHARHKFLNAHLSKELREKYGKRSVPVRKGDEVLIMRGNFAKKKGKVLKVDLRRCRITVENINRAKKDGTKVNVYLNPSNLMIQTLNLGDVKRLKRVKREGTKDKKSSVLSTSNNSSTLVKREEVVGNKKEIDKEKKHGTSDKNASK